MIGLSEIIFSFIMFCIIWFFIFKFALMIHKKKIIKNMSKRVESQDVKTDLINEIKKLPQPEKKVKPKEIKKKQGFFSKLFKKKKEVKNNDLDE